MRFSRSQTNANALINLDLAMICLNSIKQLICATYYKHRWFNSTLDQPGSSKLYHSPILFLCSISSDCTTQKLSNTFDMHSMKLGVEQNIQTIEHGKTSKEKYKLCWG